MGLFVFVFIREPARGAAESKEIKTGKIEKPFKKILTVKNRLRWIIASGIAVQMAGYSGNGFIVALLQRWKVVLLIASLIAGGIVGITGLIALTVGAQISDKVHKKSSNGRLIYGAVSMVFAAVFTLWSLRQDANQLTAFAFLFGFGWLMYYNCSYRLSCSP